MDRRAPHSAGAPLLDRFGAFLAEPEPNPEKQKPPVPGRSEDLAVAPAIELQEAGGGADRRVSVRGAFLDDYDDAGSRERGTLGLLDALGKSS